MVLKVIDRFGHTKYYPCHWLSTVRHGGRFTMVANVKSGATAYGAQIIDLSDTTIESFSVITEEMHQNETDSLPVV